MAKYCILKNNKICTNCGECDKCDLEPTKICTNCGKCLELEGYDIKEIKIDEILEDNSDIQEYKLDEDDINNNTYNIENIITLNEDLKESDITVDYIDDIDGLREVLEEDDKEDTKIVKEIFPGLIILNTNKLKTNN